MRNRRRPGRGVTLPAALRFLIRPQAGIRLRSLGMTSLYRRLCDSSTPRPDGRSARNDKAYQLVSAPSGSGPAGTAAGSDGGSPSDVPWIARSAVPAKTARPTDATALITAHKRSPRMNAARAASPSASPGVPARRSATSRAPGSVASAARIASAVTPGGIASPSTLRYTATPILPNTAIPNAPPNSALVSDIADAAPARSGGADPMIRSVVSVNTGATPIESTTVTNANAGNPTVASIPASIQ